MENNYDVFKYLKPQENTKISDFHGYDILDLIEYINRYFLEFRDELNTSSKATIGFEIEFENKENSNLVPVKDTDWEIKPNWNLREDGTLEHGGEIVSPILYNNKASWNEFLSTFQLFNDKQEITDTCSNHVHIGAQSLGNNPLYWNNFLYLWSIYENIIYRFCYGEYLNARMLLNKYAPPIASKIDKLFKSLELEYGSFYDLSRIMPLKEYEFSHNLKDERYHAINFLNVRNLNGFEEYNTLEFRVGNGTLNPIIIQNYANLYLNLLEYSKSELFNRDILDNRRSNIKYFGKLDYYNKIYFDQALEFCDLIFNNNLDKIYFLRQYLKDNDTTNHIGLVKAKKFTI